MLTELALFGGKPVRQTMLPYGQQWIDDEDVASVIEVLRSGWLTTGPKVDEFEQVFADRVGARYAVAVNSGTAALHAAVHSAGIAAGDEVIVAPLTFAASANCVVYQKGIPVFADVQPDTLNIDPETIKQRITSRTKAIISVDYTGQPCDYDVIRTIAEKHHLIVIEDAAHALGAVYHGRNVGSLNELTTFSTHPVKHITTGEGGIITTNDSELTQKMRYFRNHGITTDSHQRQKKGNWIYEMVDLGYNYRLPDILCALGLSQLSKLETWLARRKEIATQYTAAFANIPEIKPLHVLPGVDSAWHLYVIQLNLEYFRIGRAEIFKALRAENIGVNVHYIPVYYHPFYRQRFEYKKGLCPVAEAAYERLITLPLFPKMSNTDIDDVISAVFKVVEAYHQ